MTGRFSPSALLIGLALAGALVLPGAAQARVDVNIGINLPAPPQLVAVPSAPGIAYAPAVDGNYFFFDGQYYVFANGAWYVSRGYNGPWVVLAPDYVPQPLLAVPVRYYHRPPTAWRGWRREAPPRWEANWGHRWQDRRHEGQALPRERGDGRHDERRGQGHGERERDHHEERR